MGECAEKTMEQTLKDNGELLTVASGISMLPCIRPQKDILHLVRSTETACQYDVILYRRKNGKLILHRVMECQNSRYVLCGDNQSVLEYGIEEAQILGVLRGFYRGNHYIDCETNPIYEIYVKVWCSSLKARKWFLCFMNLGIKGWKKITWKKRN